MGKYDQDSKELLNHIGGKENIQAVTQLHYKNAFCTV